MTHKKSADLSINFKIYPSREDRGIQLIAIDVRLFCHFAFLIIYFDAIIIKIISLSLIMVFIVDDMLKRMTCQFVLKLNLLKIDRGAYLIAILMCQCFVKFFL